MTCSSVRTSGLQPFRAAEPSYLFHVYPMNPSTACGAALA